MVSSDTPPATPTGSQSTQAYQPPKPLFGDLTQVSDTSFEPWIGGIPRVDYSDLKTKPALIEPTMYRSTYIGSAIKAEVYRNQGLKPVYDKGGDLQALQKNLMKHFRAHGLDTITYVKNTSASSTTPTGTKENPDVLCVVEHHTRFTVDSVKAFMDTVKDKLDSYALKATKDANEDEATRRQANMIEIIGGGEVFTDDETSPLSVFYSNTRIDGNYHHHFRDFDLSRPRVLGADRFRMTPQSYYKWLESYQVLNRQSKYYRQRGYDFLMGIYDIETIFDLALVKDMIVTDEEMDEPLDYFLREARTWPNLRGNTCIRPGPWTEPPDLIEDPISPNAYALNFIKAVQKGQSASDTTSSDEDNDGNDDPDPDDQDQDDLDDNQGDGDMDDDNDADNDDEDDQDPRPNDADPCAPSRDLQTGYLGAYTTRHTSDTNAEY
jgi:hypothetical protein